MIDEVRGPVLFSGKLRERPPAFSLYNTDVFLEDCECCGSIIGPCTDWPWHYEDEDCRAMREPAE